jgi:hypothetical protein
MPSRLALKAALPVATVDSRMAMDCITPSFRGDAQHRTRNLEIPGLVLRTIPE